jgi:hypothetical protein
MGEILISFDYGRRAEYLTSYALSPYAITVPIRGHDDRVESDFLCIGFEEIEKSFIPNLKLLFWVQTKSQSSKTPRQVVISSPSKVESILNNKMPYFIAIVNTKSTPSISLYGTGERVAFKHMYPHLKPEKIHFIPGMPKDQRMYRFDKSKHIAVIRMGKPFLEFKVEKNYDRINEYWKILKDKIEKEYKNFIYASAGLGIYERERLPWVEPGAETKIFYPTNGKLTNETMMSIRTALLMLNLTLIDKERKKNPSSELVKAFDVILKNFT